MLPSSHYIITESKSRKALVRKILGSRIVLITSIAPADFYLPIPTAAPAAKPKPASTSAKAAAQAMFSVSAVFVNPNI
jgi:hypothetical protein